MFIVYLNKLLYVEYTVKLGTAKGTVDVLSYMYIYMYIRYPLYLYNYNT